MRIIKSDSAEILQEELPTQHQHVATLRKAAEAWQWRCVVVQDGFSFFARGVFFPRSTVESSLRKSIASLRSVILDGEQPHRRSASMMPVLHQVYQHGEISMFRVRVVRDVSCV